MHFRDSSFYICDLFPNIISNLSGVLVHVTKYSISLRLQMNRIINQSIFRKGSDQIFQREREREKVFQTSDT